jgi:DNA polymerase alpha subunit A
LPVIHGGRHFPPAAYFRWQKSYLRNRTLNGGRAERNEYILLHEFHRLKYICPDKSFGKKIAPIVELDDEGNEMKVSHKSKRDKYKGGLVFEPKRGLWDKYILVMDFNSLYPSIIQEYNIDFTTVERIEMDEVTKYILRSSCWVIVALQNNEEKMAEPPAPEVPQGVLPRLIAQLVSRRRHVKALMKDKTTPAAKLLQVHRLLFSYWFLLKI